MYCEYFQAAKCRSCQWLEKEYPQQISDKQNHLQLLLADYGVKQYLAPVISSTQAFRNKAKMVVSGSVERLVLGILTDDNHPVDLCLCPLYSTELQTIFPVLKQFIVKAGLTPYNIERKRGELKYIIITENDKHEFMLRFVLRTENKITQLRNALPWLLQEIATIKVVSANIQPVHMAILQGEIEIALTENQMLQQMLNQVPLYIRPQSFFQTNNKVASQLYATAKEWLKGLPVKNLWDLFCGVGGFGLHCAVTEINLTGIEINDDAINCAKRSAQEIGLTSVQFQALDSTEFALDQDMKPDAVIVNPPRRGIGQALCHYFNQLQPETILYSSCNAETLAKDINMLTNYHVERVQLFDMFPHTSHYEVLVLLQLKG